MQLLGVLLVTVAWLVLVPEPILAWGPATHMALGEALLGALYLLPPALQGLLSRHPFAFLYGSLAADISLAKKYVPEGRHCHNWAVGEEILASADSEPLQAVGYGYLAHLAADTVAHNFFVPRQLLLTSTTQALGHAYWEHRMDMHLGLGFLRKARHLVMENDHAAADALLDTVLSRTLFSFRTNRRIFRGMIRFQGHERWQRVFELVLAKSRFDLPDPVVDHYFALAFDHVVGYLRLRHASAASSLDPIGDLSLRLAKKVRRLALADRTADHPELLAEVADDFFPLPSSPLLFWPQVRDPELAAGITSRRAAQRALPGQASSRPRRAPRRRGRPG